LLNEINDDQTRQAKRELNALTEATGGQAYYLNNASEAAATARTIAHDIRNQYTLAYTPSNQDLDGTYRRIQVVVEGPNQPSVRTRSGYWAASEVAVRGVNAPTAVSR
jgi:VWFA-related protein